MARYTRRFDEVGMADVGLVGGKNASLGEMYRELSAAGIRVPNGFCVTAEAYRDMLTGASAWTALKDALEGLDVTNPEDLARRGRRAREIILAARMPDALRDQILAGYASLRHQYGDDVRLAVRSSATSEDLPDASFAGQHESYLNVRGEADLLGACQRCFASLFLDRAIHYRVDQGFDHLSVALSIGIMKLVRSDLAASGVMFSIDPESGFRDVVLLTGGFGLGENIVQGTIDPDEFTVHKATYLAGHRAVLRHQRGSKAMAMVLDDEGHGTKNVATSPAQRASFCLSDDEILELTGYACAIESHYGRPMDMEWAKDGDDQLLYLVQARPETSGAQRTAMIERFVLDGSGPVVVEGRAVGTKIATGQAKRIDELSELSTFTPGEVLVAQTTTPDWEPVMKMAAAIVTDHGGRTCHAAIVARELGIPAVVGTEEATARITTGQPVTVSCAQGDTGQVLAGTVDFHVEQASAETLGRPATKIMVNLGNPDLAFSTALLPNDGVGLARMEFVIGESIKAHPLALIHPERISDPDARAGIEALIRGYPDGPTFFVERLSEGIGTIAAAFWPKPVVVRMSDFKTNEYASLLGGADFEPLEHNPMIGFRGASRYAHSAYEEGFALECAAMVRVREQMGLTNVILMLPFVRRVEEAEAVLAKMAELGLQRGAHGLKVYAMCEIPNNVILVDRFAQLFDGFSIGSNDLTQLTLGVDRDNEIVAFDYDERDEGVKELIRMAIEGCQRNHIHSGICGQAPSDYPEMAAFLVEVGIDSISLNPDTVLDTTMSILKLEETLRQRRSQCGPVKALAAELSHPGG